MTETIVIGRVAMIARSLAQWRVNGGSDYDGFFLYVNEDDVEYLLSGLTKMADEIARLTMLLPNTPPAAQDIFADAEYEAEMVDNPPNYEELPF